MSLRVRLVLLIVALVALVAIALSAVHLASLVDLLTADALERSKTAAEEASTFVKEHIAQHSESHEAPPDINGVKILWTEIVSSDPDIPTMLVNTLKLSGAIKDINIAGPAGTIVASSNPLDIGKPLVILPSFEDWSAGSFYQRLLDLIKRRADYQVLIPLGVMVGAKDAASVPDSGDRFERAAARGAAGADHHARLRFRRRAADLGGHHHVRHEPGAASAEAD